ncbi:TFIIB-type zinc ribbon-containing protein [Anaeromyxobacter terrae]|uniref:TFIIB-type zinc ribbon-containing protein n=1 Tax=Anaeromyxobacter terrae TaxID=2925406 RepID=UPI001F56D74D|nr:zf-TFIIB domain-containing protein [Anaeromyxobacter sp. SG22]
MIGARLTCPDCKVDLAQVASGSVLAHRCERCRGIWLDPGSFQRLCEEETRPPDDETGPAPSRGAGAPRVGPGQTERVRYRACPECRDVMNRSNFGRVSGVVIDVCRQHGAWFDRGELGAIRRFLRNGGVRKYEQRRRAERERPSPSGAGRPLPREASLDDLYDVLAGNDGGWDVPSRIPRLLVAAFFAVVGVWSLWRAFHPRYFERSYGAGPVLLGLVSLYFAWRALEQWAAGRGR